MATPWKIVLMIVIIFMVSNSYQHPLKVNDEDEEIDSDTSLIEENDYDNLETSTIDLNETNISLTTENEDFTSTTLIPQINSTKNQNDTIVLRTFAYDGPLVVQKLQVVKISQKIPIFFRIIINNDPIKDDPFIIESSTQADDSTTTDSNLDVL